MTSWYHKICWNLRLIGNNISILNYLIIGDNILVKDKKASHNPATIREAVVQTELNRTQEK